MSNSLGIGSDFLVETVTNKEKGQINDFIKFYGKNYLYLDSGRGALKYIASKSPIKTILIPDYLCESMIQPFIEEKFTINYYHINEDLTPCIKSIQKYEVPGVFLHLGYFGFNTNNNLKEVIDYYRNKGSIVVEDITHNFFSKHKKTYKSDYYIASLRKWLGIYDGGVLITNKELNVKYTQQNDVFINLRKKADQLKKNYKNSVTNSKEYLDYYANSEEHLNKNDIIYSISQESLKILMNTDFHEMIYNRRKNYLDLIDLIHENKYVKTIFELSKNDVPLFFPVYIDKNRNDFRNSLISEKVYAPIHWPIPKNEESFTKIQNIYERILSIPIDQRYTSEHMKFISKVINNIQSKDEFN